MKRKEEKMNKIGLDDLLKIIVEKHNLSAADAEKFVRLMFDTVNEGLQDDKLVKVKGLGTFKVNSVKDRESIDVNTGERIVIEGRDKINFIPDSILKDVVNRPFAQFETVEVNEGVDFSAIDQKFEEENQDNRTEVADSVEEADPAAESVQPVFKGGGVQQEVQAEDTSSRKETSPVSQPNSVKQIQTTAEDLKEDTVNLSEVISLQHTEEGKANCDSQEKESVIPDDSFTGQSKVKSLETVPRKKKNIRWFCLFIFAVVVVLGVTGFAGYEFGKKIAFRQAGYSGKETPTLKFHNAPAKKTVKVADRILKSEQRENRNELKNETVEKTKAEVKDIKARKSQPSTVNVGEKVTEEKIGGYDRDPRVRTGAYVITGIDRTVKVRKGQTLSSISRAVLGPGMECYMEAVNGTAPVKEGQNVKIPKLILKKKLK